VLRCFLSNSIDVHYSTSLYQLIAQPSLHTVKCDDCIQLLSHVVPPVVFPCWVNDPSHTGFKQRSHLGRQDTITTWLLQWFFSVG